MSLWTFFRRNNLRPQDAGAPNHKMQVRVNVYLQLLCAEKKCQLGVFAFTTVFWLDTYVVFQT